MLFEVTIKEKNVVEGLLLPNDVVEDRIVIASCYVEDNIGLYLLLEKDPPYFTVARHTFGEGYAISLGLHHNIVPAVDQYKDNGGDY